MVKGCKELINELDQIINDDELELKDDERIARIDKIYMEMQNRYQFSRSFAGQVKLLVVSRLKEKNEAGQLSSLYFVK
jgi:hypothetical protein